MLQAVNIQVLVSKLHLKVNTALTARDLGNVFHPKEHDAVNFGLVQRITQNEIPAAYEVTSSMRTDIDNNNNNNLMIRILKELINVKLKNLQIHIEQDLSVRNTELITQLDT